VQAGKTSGATIADGILVKHPGELTMSVLDELLDEIVHVEDDAISEAITVLLERSKLVVEGAGAASVAALLHGAASGENACALLSGGNIDATRLMSVVRHGLTRAGRSLVLRTRVPDRPGGLVKLLELVAAERGNIVEVNHRREGFGLDVAETGVELTIITRNEEHCRELVAALEQHGYRVESVNRRSA
jgi:threonine dehydratase